MTALHVRFWLLGGLGILLDGFDFFIIGVANPLIKKDFHASAVQVGLVSAAAIFGAVFGASLLGPLGDRLGRSLVFKFDLVLFVICSLLCTAAWNLTALFVFRFGLGLAIGLDYPIAASYLAEVLPSKARGRWLTAAFSLQAAGILLGAAAGVVILEAMLFNTFMNAGPNATTYAIPAEVFPSEVRAAGHGFAAGCGKLGAALGVFLFPILLDGVGTSALLYMIAGGCLLGLLVTVLFRIEPKGRPLDDVSGQELEVLDERVVPA